MRLLQCCLMCLTLSALSAPGLHAQDLLVPAGTLLQCTLEEPRLSSKTTNIDDPVLCHLRPLRMFGRWIFPRGASLGGRLADYREPGRFVGKGWIRLEFDRLLLHNDAFPLSARVVGAGPLEVDREGRARGRGNRRRDVIGWAIPLLWPIKLVTLPMRGPRPTFTGEARVTLRLLEDIWLPPFPSASSRLSPQGQLAPAREQSIAALHHEAGISGPPVKMARVLTPVRSEPNLRPPLPSVESQEFKPRQPVTVLVLNRGEGISVTDYWMENDGLHYVTPGGRSGVVNPDEVDFATTRQLNTERGVEFALRGRVR